MSAAPTPTNSALRNFSAEIELPSSIPEHVSGNGAMDSAASPERIISDSRHTAVPLGPLSLKLAEAENGPPTSKNVAQTKGFLRRSLSDVRRLSVLSHEGLMGAGLARDSDSAFKRVCRAAVFSVIFEWSILLVIFLNTITMMVKGPDPPGIPSSFASSLAGKSHMDNLDVIDLAVTVVFTIEAILKIWLQGISEYLSDNYSRFDIVSVVLSWISVALDTLAPSSTSGLNLSAIRSLRAVRPLRALRFFPNFRFIVEAAYRSLLSVGSSSILLGFFILLYSIIGLQFFMDKMGSSCTYKDALAPPPLTTIYCSSDIDCHRFSKDLTCSRSAAEQRDGTWDRRFMSYDNIGSATLVMLRVITWDGWYNLVYELSARHVPFSTLFFVLQILTVCFLSLNMFTAVVVNVFMNYRAEYVSVITEEVEQLQRFDAPSSADSGLTSEFVREAMTSAMQKLPLSPRQRQVVKSVSNTLRIQWSELQRWYRNQVMEHLLYTVFMIVLLLVNVVSLCMYYDDGHGMPRERKVALDEVQKWCILIGNIELIIRFMSYQSLHAAYEGIGALDPIINILSIIGIFAEDEFPNISIFRLFKFLRSAFVFEILYHFENVRRLYIAVSKTIEMLLPLLSIMMLVTCVYALMGMQIFGFTFHDVNGHPTRLNFDSFRNSFFTLFQVITLDEWVSIACDGLQSKTVTSRILIIPYLLIFVIIECYVLLNLFIAVVVEKFELTNDTKEREQRVRKRVGGAFEDSQQLLHDRAKSLLRLVKYVKQTWPFARKAIVPDTTGVVHGRKSAAVGAAVQNDDRNDVVLDSEVANDRSGLNRFAAVSVAVSAAQKFLDSRGSSTRRALDLCCCLPVRHRLRSFAFWLIQNSWFDHVVLLMVILSSVLIAWESPDVTDGRVLTIFQNFNVFFLSFFAAEVALKALALGWPIYLCDWWNIFDLAVVVLMVFDLTVDANLGYVRVFRTTRVLRALKIMNKVDEIKHFIASLLDSWPELLSISLGFTVFIFLWGIIGISLFAGKTKFCTGDVAAAYALCFGPSTHPTSGFLIPNAWIPGGGVDSRDQWSGSFDDIQSSVVALFEVSTLNNWGIIRAVGVDSTAALSPPVFDSNPWASLYFIAFVFIAVFYLLNIVICTLVNTYRKKTGSAYRTEEQRMWHDIMRLSVALKPQVSPAAPKSKMGRYAFDVLHGTRFELVSLAFIVLSAVTLCMEYSSQPELYTLIIGYIHIAVSAELVCELVLRFLATPVLQFVTDAWNVFDLIIVALSVVLGLISIYFDGSLSLGIVQALRVVRIVRVVRVIRMNKMLQMSITTISMSYIYLATAMLILLICIFIFAVLAFSLFGKVKYGRSLTADTTNFNNFPNAVFSLLVMSTSYEHSFVSELSVQHPYCTTDSQARLLGVGPVGDCGDSVAANVMFPLFFFFSAHFALSILSAVIVENFAICSVLHCVVFSRICWKDFETFKSVWMIFDPYCKGRLNIDLIDEIVVMMGRLDSALGSVCPSRLSIQCLKLYASRLATTHVSDSDLSWHTFFRAHEQSASKMLATGKGGSEDYKALMKESHQADRHVTFRGLLFCLALFKAEEHCLTYTESLVKHRFVEFVRRKASVQLLEQWALKNLKRKALIKKYGDMLIQALHLTRFAKTPWAANKARMLRDNVLSDSVKIATAAASHQRRGSLMDLLTPSPSNASSSRVAPSSSSSSPLPPRQMQPTTPLPPSSSPAPSNLFDSGSASSPYSHHGREGGTHASKQESDNGRGIVDIDDTQ